MVLRGNFSDFSKKILEKKCNFPLKSRLKRCWINLTKKGQFLFQQVSDSLLTGNWVGGVQTQVFIARFDSFMLILTSYTTNLDINKTVKNSKMQLNIY